MTYIPVELRASTRLRCPHCGGAGLSVHGVHINLPTDAMVLRFEWDALTLTEVDGGAGGPASVVLAVDCPRCGMEYGQTYLQIYDGQTRVGDFAARFEWDTDEDVPEPTTSGGSPT